MYSIIDIEVQLSCVFQAFGTVAYTAFSLVLNSKCKGYGQKTLKLPMLGKMTILSLVVLIICFVFAIVWAATRKKSFSWIGQDILVSYISP